MDSSGGTTAGLSQHYSSNPSCWGVVSKGDLKVSSGGSTILDFLGFGPIWSQLQLRLILVGGLEGWSFFKRGDWGCCRLGLRTVLWEQVMVWGQTLVRRKLRVLLVAWCPGLVAELFMLGLLGADGVTVGAGVADSAEGGGLFWNGVVCCVGNRYEYGVYI